MTRTDLNANERRQIASKANTWETYEKIEEARLTLKPLLNQQTDILSNGDNLHLNES